jgi:Putative auto-transporter adhesin, head GIN domain
MSVIHSLLAAGALAGLVATPALADPGVRIDHAAARVVVIVEPRDDYAIAIDQGRAGLRPLEIRKDGGVTVVDGGYGVPGVGFFGFGGLNCHGRMGRQFVSIPGRGEVAVSDLPLVTIHAPLDARIGAGQAVFGEVRGARSLDLGNAGCGDWRIGDVHGPVHLSLAGSGDVRGGNVGDARIDISGSADVVLGAVGGRLETRTSGSGDIHVAAISGPIDSKIAGSGDVTVDGGEAPEVGVSIAGSGDLKFHGTAGAVRASIAGSGDVDIARATGPISKHVAGSGGVNIGR